MEHKLLILENDISVEKTFISELRKYTSEEPFILQAILWRDLDVLLKYINTAEKIAFKSMFGHPEQVNQLMELFSNLPKKTVYIKTDYREVLEEHPLYEVNASKHKIIYL